MTRNNSTALTKLARDQYEVYRRQVHARLAARVLDIVGVRWFAGKMYVTTKDVFEHEHELLELLGEIRGVFTSKERQRLYKDNQHLGMSVVKLVLEAAGHPLTRATCRIDRDTTCSKFALDPDVH